MPCSKYCFCQPTFHVPDMIFCVRSPSDPSMFALMICIPVWCPSTSIAAQQQKHQMWPCCPGVLGELDGGWGGGGGPSTTQLDMSVCPMGIFLLCVAIPRCPHTLRVTTMLKLRSIAEQTATDRLRPYVSKTKGTYLNKREKVEHTLYARPRGGWWWSPVAWRSSLLRGLWAQTQSPNRGPASEGFGRRARPRKIRDP